MHWSDKIAAELISKNPQKQQFVCAAGISPSGSIHIGNFRDVVTSYFVCLALGRLGKKARLVFSWDEFDRFRKVPVNVAEIAPGFEEHLGKAYVDVPDPFGCCQSYAQHFEKEFQQALAAFNIDVEYRYQAQLYRAGNYSGEIIHALRSRQAIFDILACFRTQAPQPGERENYYPVSIYCPQCGKDSTKINSLSQDACMAEFTCKCGYSGSFNFNENYNCKLAWKVDWPMRWKHEGIDFEPGGKDHASPMGSYTNSSIISKEIFGYTPPLFQGYEFIGIKGTTGKMSGSSGLNLTPAALLKLYQPEVMLWLYSRTPPSHSFDFCLDEEILRQYFEFDKAYNAVQNESADERTKEIMQNTPVGQRSLCTVPMAQLATLGSVVDFSEDMMETIFEKIGTPYTKAQFAERLALAKYWAQVCSPESLNQLLPGRNWEYYQQLPPQRQQDIAALHSCISAGGYTLDEMNQQLYAIPAAHAGTDEKARKAAQSLFFKDVYQLLLAKEKGPRLYLFLYAISAQQYLPLLSFSTPKTKAELEMAKQIQQEQKEQAAQQAACAEQGGTASTQQKAVGEKEGSGTAGVKPQLGIDDFKKLDLRVCKIIDCQEIKASRNCLRLRLLDGQGEREIVSSIKGIYAPGDLIGRKIIVLVNLKPAKMAGVQSQGMLLAAEGEGFGCQLLFAGDDVPEGTPVC